MTDEPTVPLGPYLDELSEKVSEVLSPVLARPARTLGNTDELGSLRFCNESSIPPQHTNCHRMLWRESYAAVCRQCQSE